MNTLEKVLYTARTHTTGGRDGQAQSDDGKLQVTLSSFAGTGTGTNPEQMFAAGYSACFMGALRAVAAKSQITLPADMAVDAEVDLGPVGPNFGIAVRLKVALPGLAAEQAQSLLTAADAVCPYSNATRGNIPVAITLA
mgnify:CR=1 FL=1